MSVFWVVRKRLYTPLPRLNKELDINFQDKLLKAFLMSKNGSLKQIFCLYYESSIKLGIL